MSSQFDQRIDVFPPIGGVPPDQQHFAFRRDGRHGATNHLHPGDAPGTLPLDPPPRMANRPIAPSASKPNEAGWGAVVRFSAIACPGVP